MTSEASLQTEALCSVLQEGADSLEQSNQLGKAEAAAARRVQEVCSGLLDSDEKAIRLQAYWLSNAIEDVFYNIFGDLPFSKVTEEARKETCRDLRDLFASLAPALAAGNAEGQIHAWEGFVTSYLDRVRNLNDAWRRGEAT